MQTSEQGLYLIRHSEGLWLIAYLCPAGVWTIGYGHTKGVKKGDTCTREQAEAWLLEDVRDAIASIEAMVTVPLTQGQMDALVSFVFNFGAEKFRISTLLRLLNQGLYPLAAAQFSRWINGTNPKTGLREVMPGLVKRRAAEKALFESGG
jgi:lysozyme